MRLLSVLLFILTPGLLTAGDWPQILGPARNGIAEHESISTHWGVQGPKLLWSAQLGSGFAGPAVRDGKVYQLHRVDDQLLLECYSAQQGTSIWTAKHPCDYRATISYDDGPRCVPTVTATQVITYGPAGQLQAVEIKSGKRQWIVDTHEKYRADAGYFGAGSSPLVVDDRVIVNVGGARNAAGLVAFRLTDGEELWTSTNEAASYSSPILSQIGNQRVVIAITRLNCVGLDPDNGKVLFEFPFGKRGPTVNAANPIVVADKLFLTASYGIGAMYGSLTPKGFDEQFSSDTLLSSQYSTPISGQGHLFGVHGRQDIGVAELRCLHPASQKVLWSKPLPGYGTILRAEETLLIATIDGTLIAAKADPRTYQELARAQVQKTTQGGLALPALSNGLLYLRDADTLRCLDLRKTK